MSRTKHHPKAPAFTYRSGIGIAGTPITCDALGFPDDLIFLAHARALAPADVAFLASARAGRRQVVTTERTLRLLGAAGERLRSRALPAAFGRPFNLGAHRIEVVPSGYLPGAAALLCRSEKRQVLYAGAFCLEPLVDGLEPGEIRRAHALCVNATFAAPGLDLPPRRQALAEVRAFVEEALADNRTPVLLASPLASLVPVAFDLARAGLPLRAHAGVARALEELRSLCPTLPLVKRFSGRAARGEVLLWPPEARDAAALHRLDPLRLALVSGQAKSPEVLARMRLSHGFALTTLPNFKEILTLVEASGATEVALDRGPAEPLLACLGERGLFAYTLGPPRQMSLL